MQFVLVTKDSTLYASKTIVNAISHAQDTVTIIAPKNLRKSDSIEALKECDFIINRNAALDYSDSDLDLYKSLNLNKKLSNSIKCSSLLRDKFVQYEFLRNLLSDELVIPSYQITDKSQQNAFNDRAILKTRRGHQSLGVRATTNLSKDIEDLLLAGDKDWIYQPYIDFEKEWRQVILRTKSGEIADIYTVTKSPRVCQDFNILNFNNSTTTLIETNKVPEQLQDLSIKVANNLEATFITVDYLEDRHGHFRLLEVNNSPGFEGLDTLLSSQCTQQSSIARKLIRTIKS